MFRPSVVSIVNAMGRPLRVWVEGATYHLFSRGSDRRRIFDGYRDYAQFMALFSTYAAEFNLDCFAWALMPNHWHLMVRSPSRGLSDFVKRLNHRHSIRSNRRKRRTAHLFTNRFGSVLQETDGQFLNTVRYVLCNPVEAGLCNSVEEWRWTSYHATVRPDSAPPFLRVAELLGHFGGSREQQIDAFKAHLNEA